MGWGPTLHFKQVPRQCWSTKHEDLEPVGRRWAWVPASLLGNRTHTGFGVGLGSWVWVPQASCVPLTGLTMATASGTSKANISRASVALRSANTQLRPSPWSRAAWPAWTPTPSCCLSWAPCPLSTPESGPHPPSPPLDGHQLSRRPCHLLLTAHLLFPQPFTHSCQRPWRSDSPSLPELVPPWEGDFRAGHTPVPHPQLKFDELKWASIPTGFLLNKYWVW